MNRISINDLSLNSMHHELMRHAHEGELDIEGLDHSILHPEESLQQMSFRMEMNHLSNDEFQCPPSRNEEYKDESLDLQPLIDNFKNRRVNSRDILRFLDSLPLNNLKNGSALSWNRALKVMKAHDILLDNYKPYAQMRTQEKIDVKHRLLSCMDLRVLNEIKAAILSGFLDMNITQRTRSDEQNISWHRPSGVLDEDLRNDLIHVNKKQRTILKQNDIIQEQIKNLKLERLRSAMNDKTTWDLLSNDVKEKTIEEYSRLLT